MNRKKDSDATVDMSEIKNGEPVSLFIIQVAAPSWAATQIPEITLAIQSCLKAGFLRAVQVEYLVTIENEGPNFLFVSRRTVVKSFTSIGFADDDSAMNNSYS